MKITRTGKDTVEILAETEDDQLVLNRFRDDALKLKAENDSLRKQVRILADDNKYLTFMLEKNNIKYDFREAESKE